MDQCSKSVPKGIVGQSQAGTLLFAPSFMYNTVQYNSTKLKGFIDLCCNATFEGTICQCRPEELEMDLAGLSF